MALAGCEKSRGNESSPESSTRAHEPRCIHVRGSNDVQPQTRVTQSFRSLPRCPFLFYFLLHRLSSRPSRPTILCKCDLLMQSSSNTYHSLTNTTAPPPHNPAMQRLQDVGHEHGLSVTSPLHTTDFQAFLQESSKELGQSDDSSKQLAPPSNVAMTSETHSKVHAEFHSGCRKVLGSPTRHETTLRSGSQRRRKSYDSIREISSSRSNEPCFELRVTDYNLMCRWTPIFWR
jgi:hypothetical protein